MGLACSQGRAASLVPVRWGCRQWPGGGCGGVSPASTGSASRVEAVVPDRPRRPLWPCPAWLGVRVGSWTPSLSPVSSAAKHSGPLSPESAGRGLPCGRPPPPPRHADATALGLRGLSGALARVPQGAGCRGWSRSAGAPLASGLSLRCEKQGYGAGRGWQDDCLGPSVALSVNCMGLGPRLSRTCLPLGSR